MACCRTVFFLTTALHNILYHQVLILTCFQQLTLNIRYLVVEVHDSWMEFQDYFRQQVLFLFLNS